MFEGTLNQSGFPEADDSGELKPVEWHVLAARLAAARELRCAMAQNRVSKAGNFARFSVTKGEGVNENRVHVNPDALIDCSSSGDIVPVTAIDPQSGDRE